MYPPMPRPTRILVPIRYPITGRSAQTLARAKTVAQEHEEDGRVELLILHINLIQYNRTARKREIRRAVRSMLDGISFTVVTRQGLLLEETILDEARSIGADFVIVGTNQSTRWRRLISRFLPSGPNLASYLRENISPDAGLEVVE